MGHKLEYPFELIVVEFDGDLGLSEVIKGHAFGDIFTEVFIVLSSQGMFRLESRLDVGLVVLESMSKLQAKVSDNVLHILGRESLAIVASKHFLLACICVCELTNL